MDKKKMPGGTCYLQNGNMVSGVYRDFVILRLGENGARQALEQAREFVMTLPPK
jgi:TfoX/Sxy family transcriptional regulator of competence genes